MMRMLRMCLARSGPTPDSLGQRFDRDRDRRECLRGRLGHRVQRLRREAVADPEVGVDVTPARRGALELLAKLAYEDVDRAVAVGHRVAPDPLVHALARNDAARGAGEQVKKLELAPREPHRAATDEGLEHVRPDLQLSRDDRLDRLGGELTGTGAPDCGPATRGAPPRTA